MGKHGEKVTSSDEQNIIKEDSMFHTIQSQRF